MQIMRCGTLMAAVMKILVFWDGCQMVI